MIKMAWHSMGKVFDCRDGDCQKDNRYFTSIIFLALSLYVILTIYSTIDRWVFCLTHLQCVHAVSMHMCVFQVHVFQSLLRNTSCASLNFIAQYKYYSIILNLSFTGKLIITD